MRWVLFGPGYAGRRIVAAVEARGGVVVPVGRSAEPAAVRSALAGASHVLSTVPPVTAGDPVLAAYGAEIGRVPWIGYLSSTGVYGDTGGAWVDESAPLLGRRGPRTAADVAWQALGARVFRLPGIYGPGRSVLDRIAEGRAHRIDLPEQVFSRVHVDDIAGAVLAASTGAAPAGVYNVSDDLPAAQNDLVAWGCAVMGAPLPALLPADGAGLSAEARAFYAENRRVTNGKAKRVLGWRPIYPTWREGLGQLSAGVPRALLRSP